MRRGPPLAPELVATLATGAVLFVGTVALLAVHPSAAAAWLASSALMTWRFV